MEFFITIGILALIIAVISAKMISANKKLNAPTFTRGCIVANNKTKKISIVQSVDYHNRVLHTSDGGQHFSTVELLEVGDFVAVIETGKAVKIIGFIGAIIETNKGFFNYTELRR
jgi:hypothetical protein